MPPAVSSYIVGAIFGIFDSSTLAAIDQSGHIAEILTGKIRRPLI
jgi:hypothetical protein